MRVHTQGFKEQIKELGREIDSRITYDGNLITSEQLFSISPITNGTILKSTMKQLDFESSIQVPLNTVITYEFGLKVNEEYEYLNYGNYIVYSSEYNEDTKTYSYVCYDSMLNTMKDYISLQNSTFPMTVREYLTNLCLDCGLTFKNAEDEFANYNQIIDSDLYANLDYTYRDIFDELSQVTASSICIDSNDMVEIRYITETNDMIDEEYFKDINVKFGEKYGPVNSIVLSRSAESDNVYLQDEESVATNGLCEIKIIDNQIMNFNNRSDYLPYILEKLNGLEYYVNDFTSTGILYYEFCDRYTAKIGENTYSCVLFNDEPKITQGIAEDIYTEKPEESVTDYTKSDKTDRKINQAYIIVDKQNQTIQALASKIEDISTTVKGVGNIILENASETDLYKLIIKNASQIFPHSQQYPSSTLYPRSSNLIVEYEDETKIIIKLPNLNLLTFENQSDDLTIENGEIIQTKRVNMDSDGNLYLLDEPIITNLGQVFIPLKEGINKIYLQSIETAYLEATYLLKNQYTDVFANQAEVSSQIKVTTDNVLLESKSYTDTATEGDTLISKINLDSTGNVKIEASKTIDLTGTDINLTGDSVTISSNNFNVDEEGKITATAGEIGGFDMDETSFNKEVTGIYNYDYFDMLKVMCIVLDRISTNTNTDNILDANKDGDVDSVDYARIRNIINGVSVNEKNVKGYFRINSNDPKKCVVIVDENENIISSLGLGGLDSTIITCNNFICGKPGESVSDFNGATINGATGAIKCATLTQTSLESSKKNFENLDNALDIIECTDIYKYNMNTETDETKKHIGFIIGDKYNYSKEITSENNDGVDIYSMVSVCFKAIQEQQEIIKELRQEINSLKESEK